MDLTFNEISLNNKPETEYETKQILNDFASVCASLKREGFSKLRTENDFWTKKIYTGTDINSFLQKIDKTKSQFLRSFIRPPYIADDFTSEADEMFVEANYSFNGNKVVGLAYAYLLNTISVSLNTNEIWDTHEVEIIEKRNERINKVKVKNVTKTNHIEQHKEWIESNKPINLIKTNKLPADKPIKLRDDHGKDILQQFARKLVNCVYVIEIINSLPFNPNEKNFIRKIYPNGQIEIVLTTTDQGLGLKIQTTGRNQRETLEISKILREKYS